jgi:hypothetical protein
MNKWCRQADGWRKQAFFTSVVTDDWSTGTMWCVIVERRLETPHGEAKCLTNRLQRFDTF